MPIPLAVIGASLGSSVLGALSSGRAADAQEAAARGQMLESRRQYDLARNDLAPYRHIGNQALNALGSIYGYSPYEAPDTFGGSPIQNDQFQALQRVWPQIREAARWEDINWARHGMPGGPPVDEETAAFLSANWGNIRPAAALSDVDWYASTGSLGPSGGASGGAPSGQPNATAPDYSAFYASPDYNFRREEGTRGINNSFAARGGALSGNALRALNEYNSNLAAGEFGNYFNRQAALAGIGQSATNATANVGQNTAANVGNALQYGGNARASGILGQGAALNNGLQGGIGNMLLWRNVQGGGNPYGGVPNYGNFPQYGVRMG